MTGKPDVRHPAKPPLIVRRGEKVPDLLPHLAHVNGVARAADQLPVRGEMLAPISPQQRGQDQSMTTQASPKNYPGKFLRGTMVLRAESILE